MRKSQTGKLGLVRPRGLIMQLRLDLFSLWIQMPERYPETRLTVRFTSKQFDDEQVQRALDQGIGVVLFSNNFLLNVVLVEVSQIPIILLLFILRVCV